MRTLIAERSADLAVRLVAEGARFVIVGSTARRLRGAEVCPSDLDVVVTPLDLPDLGQLLAALGAHLGARLPNAGPVTVRTPWGPIDLFVTEALPPADTVTVHGVPWRWRVSDRTGLGPLEVALLRSAKATARKSPTRTTAVLDHLETVERYGPAYSVQALQHLGAPWTVHLRLFDLDGNWGSAYGDPLADPQYTALRLSPIGELALAAENGETGPIPVDLVNGSAYRGGSRPALAPRATIALLVALVRGETPTPPPYDELLTFPTDGTVHGDLPALMAGRRTRVELSCRIEREPPDRPARLVITGTPPGVPVDELEHSVRMRIRVTTRPGPRHYLREEPPPEQELCTDIRDETSARTGTRIAVTLAPGAAPDEAEAWLRSTWPVTVTADRQIPGGLDRTLRDWADRCREDRSGLDELSRLLG